jgi:hypothetical protein
LIKKFTRIVLLIGIAFASVALPVRQALAAPTAIIFDVNSFLDQPDDLTMIGTCHTAVGTCTLRAAIMQANRTSGAGSTIRLPAGLYGLTIPASGADGEENGDLNLTTPALGTSPQITINGAGASTTIIDANTLDRVFNISGNRSVTISGVTIRNGYLTGTDGGGIFNYGALTLNNCTITGNRSFDGGGIFTAYSLTINNSTISGNHAGDGAGIDNFGLSFLTVNNSTISANIGSNVGGGITNNINSTLVVSNSTISLNNSALYGGGIWNNGSAEVSGSTVYGNSATDGGGIYNSYDLTMWNSTLSQNTAKDSGGGIYNAAGHANVYNVSIVGNGADTDIVSGSAGGVYNGVAATFNMRNTLVAGNNISNSPQYDDCTGTLNSYGVNLFWSVIGCTVTNGAGGAWYDLNALNTLGPLQDNGGPTWTVALLPGSNAIDGGDPVFGCIDYAAKPFTTDQRGFPRVVGVRCDIGAFEYSPLTYLYLPVLFR